MTAVKPKADAENRAAIAPAWRELEALAVAMRPDWERPVWDVDGVRAALLAAHTAGWPFERAAVVLWRVIFDPDGTPAELRNTVRAERPQPRTGPEVGARGKAAALAAIEAALNDQPRQEAGTGDNDNQEGTPS